MKSHFSFNIGAGTIKVDTHEMEFPGIEVKGDVEYNIAELKELYELYKRAVQELPKLMADAMKDLEFATHDASADQTKS